MSDFDDYLVTVDDPAIRTILQRLRELVAGEAPGAIEGRSYGMPAFRYRDKPLAGFSASRGHAGFYPMSGSLIERHAAELAGFSTSKGTLRLTPKTGIPEDLIRILVRERMAEIDGPGSR